MNTDQLIQDAHMMLETIEQCNSPAFKATAARQLVDIAVEIAAQYYVLAVTPEQPAAAEERPVIDLAMNYRTRDGREVTDLKDDGSTGGYMFYGRVGDRLRYWDKEGFWMTCSEPSPLDLIPTGELA
jgi:hypothetical protein